MVIETFGAGGLLLQGGLTALFVTAWLTSPSLSEGTSHQTSDGTVLGMGTVGSFLRGIS